MKIIKTIIVDDEELARERIRTLLESEIEFEVIAECKDGLHAVEKITHLNPELVFLDIQMPGMNGFEVIEKLPGDELPEIVFVTAYNKYAVKAFEVNAVDYLLKPFDKERFQQTLTRTKKKILSNEKTLVRDDLLSLLKSIKDDGDISPKKYSERFAIKSSGRIIFIEIDEIDLIESAGNYIRFHIGKEKYLMRDTMNNIEDKLNPEKFIRVHRSSIINRNSIKEMNSMFQGQYEITLNNGIKIQTGRTYNDTIKNLLNNF